MSLSLALAISLLILTAWYLGYRGPWRKDFMGRKNSLPRDYLIGLNFLINEETDKAVDVFIRMLEVDSETVETHLALGKLFRRRGEVERAIRIHQNLIARPQLDKVIREQALYELGQDYLSAGMLDRAEKIFNELLSIKEQHLPALRALLDIYQQEKSWQNAIQTAQKLETAANKNLQDVVAHYYCELAENALQDKQYELAEKYLDRAIDADRQCVRASLIQAKMYMDRNDLKSALRSLKYIKAQNPDYLSEAIELLAQCYEQLNEGKGLVTYLKKLLLEYPRLPVVLILADRIRKWRGDKVAGGFVADYVRRYPTLRGLQLFLDIHLSNTDGRTKQDLLILQGLIGKFLAEKPDYQCVSCGFSGKVLHWLCPGCKQWSSIKPVYSLEEEPLV
jgi:lipopolysaccharide assembly protein B